MHLIKGVGGVLHGLELGRACIAQSVWVAYRRAWSPRRDMHYSQELQTVWERSWSLCTVVRIPFISAPCLRPLLQSQLGCVSSFLGTFSDRSSISDRSSTLAGSSTSSGSLTPNGSSALAQELDLAQELNLERKIDLGRDTLDRPGGTPCHFDA